MCSNQKNSNKNEENNNAKMNNITLDDIVGQDEAIKEIRDLLAIKSDPCIANYWGITVPKWILFVGPPGSGKTMTVRALVNESSDLQLTEIKYQDIASMWLDKSVTNLNDIFSQIEEVSKESHVIVFIDEIDSFLPERSSENLHHSYVSRVNTFIQWIDGGLQSLENVTIIGATNNFSKLDKAAIRPGRFDKIIHFKELNAEGIVSILKQNLQKRDYNDGQVGDIDWNVVNNELNKTKLTGAVASNIIRNISKRKMSEHYYNLNNSEIYSASVPKDIIMLLDGIKPSPISTSDLIDEIKLLSNHSNEF
jgi:cell division protease FtsH